MQTLITITDFLVSTLCQLYIAIILLRFLLQWFRADFRNPMAQFIIRATNPLVVPLRRLIPGWSGVDLASLLTAYMVTIFQVVLVGTNIAHYKFPGLLEGQLLSIPSLLMIALVDMLTLGIGLLSIAIIILAISSWIAPRQHNPATLLLMALTEPLLRPARRMVPTISAIDLSPLLVLMALQVLKLALVGLLLG